MKRLLLATAALLLASPALALEEPKPCSKADARVVCIPYNALEVVQLYAARGAALTVEFSSKESIVDASTSDNGLLDGGPASARQAVEVVDGGNSPATADRNLMMAKRGSFLFLKPLRKLAPQPVTVLTRREDGAMRRYTFQLETRDGDLTAEGATAYFAVRFVYPNDEAEARRAAAAQVVATRRAEAVAARLRQLPPGGPIVKNDNYLGQGNNEDRAALAPSAPPGEKAIWDDGQRTYLRYPGNRRTPMIYQVLPDGRESLVGFSSDADPTTRGTLITLHGVYRAIRLRDGKAVLCITNRAYDAAGSNPGTGTVTPDVVRETAPMPEEGPRVR
jgi:type IV secretion system protein VirB9